MQSKVEFATRLCNLHGMLLLSIYFMAIALRRGTTTNGRRRTLALTPLRIRSLVDTKKVFPLGMCMAIILFTIFTKCKGHAIDTFKTKSHYHSGTSRALPVFVTCLGALWHWHNTRPIHDSGLVRCGSIPIKTLHATILYIGMRICVETASHNATKCHAIHQTGASSSKRRLVLKKENNTSEIHEKTSLAREKIITYQCGQCRQFSAFHCSSCRSIRRTDSARFFSALAIAAA